MRRLNLILLLSAVTVALTGSYFWTISGQGINRIVPMLGNLLADILYAVVDPRVRLS